MKASHAPKLAAFIAGALLLACSGCVNRDLHMVPADREAATTSALRERVNTIVVIYAENRSFDNLFGRFPGARGIGDVLGKDGKPTAAYGVQKDRDGSVLRELPKTWGGVTEEGVSPTVSEAQSAGLPNAPFAIETAFTPKSGVRLNSHIVTRDLIHRFFENQMQIDNGSNAGFAAWSDAGGLTMGHYDNGRSALTDLARTYSLADNFFQGAFGGSFLNHQYLICACAPEYPHADTAVAKPRITVLDKDSAGHYLAKLTVDSKSPASALDGPPHYVSTGGIAPADYFGDGKFYAVNTLQPPYQPSAAEPAAGDSSRAYADPGKPITLPPQQETTIGDLLEAKDVHWAWYAGSWRAATIDGMQTPGAERKVIYAPATAGGAPDFQPHHQPFNYYTRFDPLRGADERHEHLKDYEDLIADAAAGRLPAVAFYKPQGNLNQHPGYASVAEGDAHLAALVSKLQASPQWAHMVIIITYDEFGGFWDHVPPPQADLLGPGTRIPALVISPFAKRHFIDHTQYDTGSVLRFISRRFDLPTLRGLAARDAALKARGAEPMGDLTPSLQF